MMKPAKLNIGRKLLLVFIIVNLLLCAAGAAGLVALQNLKESAPDQNALDAYNWYMKVLFGICSLTFDMAALSWYFSNRKTIGYGYFAGTAGLWRSPHARKGLRA